MLASVGPRPAIVLARTLSSGSQLNCISFWLFVLWLNLYIFAHPVALFSRCFYFFYCLFFFFILLLLQFLVDWNSINFICFTLQFPLHFLLSPYLLAHTAAQEKRTRALGRSSVARKWFGV